MVKIISIDPMKSGLACLSKKLKMSLIRLMWTNTWNLSRRMTFNSPGGVNHADI